MESNRFLRVNYCERIDRLLLELELDQKASLSFVPAAACQNREKKKRRKKDTSMENKPRGLFSVP